MLVAAMQSMACGRAHRVHTACAGRNVYQNSISGSLPTEIGKLGRLTSLYCPSFCLGPWGTLRLCEGAGTSCWWLLYRAWHAASAVHAACAGRSVYQNSISGSLPTEIGLLSRLMSLYGPSLCWGLCFTFKPLRGSRHLVLVAAMQNMACKRASIAHTACAGRNVVQNSISGSLPTEIGQLSGLLWLYGPSLCWGL